MAAPRDGVRSPWLATAATGAMPRRYVCSPSRYVVVLSSRPSDALFKSHISHCRDIAEQTLQVLNPELFVSGPFKRTPSSDKADSTRPLTR